MPIRNLIFRVVGVALCATPGWQYCIGQTTFQTTSSYWTVEVRDLSPRFLDFYRNAVTDQASPDRRWELWKEKYDFAAVPPIAAGQAIARRQLDEAWPQYQSSLARIEVGTVALRPSPQSRLDEVVALLRPHVSGRIQLTAFVGTFHRSAFASGKKEGVWQIAIPLEDSDQDHALDMTHEFTHAVQRAAGHWDGQTVGGAIFSEGLAMRVTEKLNPGFAPQIYTTSTKEWLDACAAKLPEVFHDLESHLNDSGAEAVSRFTMQKGEAGLDREVYCAGWFVIANLLKEGRSLSELGNLPQPEAIKLVGKQIPE